MGSDAPSAAVQLPAQLGEAFRLLRKGHHICRDNGPVWFDLRDNAEAYRTIFNALGYRLSDHPRGFYYFSEGQQSRPDVLSRLVYFFACLFADLDQGRFEPAITRWVDTLTDHEFRIEALADHMFTSNDRQRIFAQLQVRRDSLDKAVVAPLLRYGIAYRAQSGSIRFRQSVYRFVEFFQACADANAIQQVTQRPDSTAGADLEIQDDGEGDE